MGAVWFGIKGAAQQARKVPGRFIATVIGAMDLRALTEGNEAAR
jgi:hypothetical protein